MDTTAPIQKLVNKSQRTKAPELCNLHQKYALSIESTFNKWKIFKNKTHTVYDSVLTIIG